MAEEPDHQAQALRWRSLWNSISYVVLSPCINESSQFFFHISLLFTIFILTLSFSCKANDDNREVYIVFMGAIPEGIYSPNSHRLFILQSVLEGSSVSNYLIRSYTRSFNGFVAKLSTDQERQKLASLKEVVSVFLKENFIILKQPDLGTSWVCHRLQREILRLRVTT